jgi:hypothetical protein
MKQRCVHHQANNSEYQKKQSAGYGSKTLPEAAWITGDLETPPTGWELLSERY